MKSRLPAIPSSDTENMKKVIHHALNNSKVYSLNEFIDLRKKVIIVIDDYTRNTPILPSIEILYEKLRLIGVKNEQIFVLTSNGTHRKMNKEEIYQRLGSLSDVIKVVQHDCYDKNNLFYVGDIDGVPVTLNNLLQNDEANVIGIGSIMAHKFSGWSGGGKIICPGITGYETIFLSHKKAIMEEQISPGQSNNWFRTFINKVSKIAGLKYLINFIPGTKGVFSVLAGEPESVFKGGVEAAKNNLTDWFENHFDIAIISAYPAIYDLWQGAKAFYLGDMVLKDGGTIILATPLNEVMGDHPDFLSTLNMDSLHIRNLLDKNLIDDPLAAVAAYAIKNISEHSTLRVVSTNPAAQHIKILDHEITNDFQMVLEETLNKFTNDVIIIEDTYVLPKKNS